MIPKPRRIHKFMAFCDNASNWNACALCFCMKHYRIIFIFVHVLVVAMLGPKSYTREDVVELQCHGCEVCLRRVLRACIDAGARLAEPGEFTLRAFLNGRLDLSIAS